MPEKDVWWTDKDGYRHLVRVCEGDKPAEGAMLSVDLSEYDIPPKGQIIMQQAGFVTPYDYRAKAGVFRAMISALRVAGFPSDKWTANAIVRQIREDYHDS